MLDAAPAAPKEPASATAPAASEIVATAADAEGGGAGDQVRSLYFFPLLCNDVKVTLT